MKTVLHQLGRYKRDTLLCIGLTTFEVIMEILLPFITSIIIDQGLEASNLPVVYRYGILMVVMAFLSLVFGALAGKFAASASAGFAANLRESIYSNIQTFSFSNIDKFSVPGLVTRMTTDITNVQNAFMMLIRIAVRSPLMLIFSYAMCLIISPSLSLTFLIAVVFLAVVLGVIMVVTMKIFNQVFSKYDDLNASVQENVSAIRVVKAFVREDYECGKFSKASKTLYKMFVKAEGLLSLNNPAMMIAVYFCIIMVSWLGAHYIVAGDMTTGDLTSLFSYVMSLLMSLMMLSMVIVMISMSMASIRRISEVLNEKPDLRDPAEPISEVPDGRIDFDHVSFSYKHGSGEAVLSDIDLHIKSGETIGVIGGTGSGKSSLVNLICRLYDVDKGAVRVGGIDVRNYDMEALRNQVAVVLAEEHPLLRHHPRQPALGQPGRHRGAVHRGLPSGLRRRVHRPHARRLQHPHRARRQQRLRRPEAAPVHRPRPAQEPQGAHTRRLHQRRGHRHRRQDTRRLCQEHPRHDQDNHRPAHLER